MTISDLVYTYSLSKALTLELPNRDYLDQFRPFVVEYLKKNKSEEDRASIKEGIKYYYKFDLPLFIIETILERLENEELIIKTGHKIDSCAIGSIKYTYSLTETGYAMQNNFKNIEEIKNNIKFLIKDMQTYLNKNQMPHIDENELLRLLRVFIYINFDPKIDLEELKDKFNLSSNNISKNLENLVFYFKDLKQRNQDLYKIYTELIKGYILYLTIGDCPERDKKFNNVMLFLDTNVILKLLGIHYSEFKEPVIEMFKLIKRHEFELFVFDFTLEEARNVLNNCINEIEPSDKIKINSVCAYLKKEEHKTNTEIKYVSSNLENLLKKENITVWRSGIPISSYEPFDKELNHLLIDRKPNQRIKPRLHDIAAVDCIRDLRNNSAISRLDESKALFLTGDRILNRIVNDKYHKIDNTISEVILDKLLTNLLWLNNPSIDLDIESIVASCCKDVFISKDIWEAFIRSFNELVDKGELKEEDYRSLFYLNYLEETLKGYTQNDLKKITPDFVKIKVEEQKNRLEQMNNKWLNLIENFVLIFRIFILAIFVLTASILIIMLNLNEAANDFMLSILCAVVAFILLMITVLSGVGPFGKIWDKLIRKITDKFNLLCDQNEH